MKSNYYEQTMSNLESYFTTDSHCTFCARSLPGVHEQGFIYEIRKNKHHYFMKVRVNENMECVILEAYPGIQVAEPYRPGASLYCMTITAGIKMGFVGIEARYGDLYSHTEAPINSSALTGNEFRMLEEVAVSILNDNYDNLLRSACGMQIKNDDSEFLRFVDKILEHGHKHEESHDPENDNESSSTHRPTVILPDFFSSDPDSDKPDPFSFPDDMNE